MSQKANNPAPPVDLSNSPMLGVGSRMESEEPGSDKNKDDLYLFTRGQVFKKSGQRPYAQFKSISFPGPSSGISKLPPQQFGGYHDPGFDTPALNLPSFPGQQDGYPVYTNHGNNHGYHSTSSSPGIPASFVPSLDLFAIDGTEPLQMFGSATNSTTMNAADHAGSTSWLQQFGIQEGVSIGFGR